jgi:hypothetical protein
MTLIKQINLNYKVNKNIKYKEVNKLREFN